MKVVLMAMMVASLTAHADKNADVELATQLIRKVESNNGKYVKGDHNKGTGEYLAVGEYQLHKIMVDEVNRITKTKKYKYSDRTNKLKSKEITTIFLQHQYDRYTKTAGKPPSVVMLATAFNKGDIFRDSNDGHKRYMQKIQTELYNRNRLASR